MKVRLVSQRSPLGAVRLQFSPFGRCSVFFFMFLLLDRSTKARLESWHDLLGPDPDRISGFLAVVKSKLELKRFAQCEFVWLSGSFF